MCLLVIQRNEGLKIDSQICIEKKLCKGSKFVGNKTGPRMNEGERKVTWIDRNWSNASRTQTQKYPLQFPMMRSQLIAAKMHSNLIETWSVSNQLRSIPLPPSIFAAHPTDKESQFVFRSNSKTTDIWRVICATSSYFRIGIIDPRIEQIKCIRTVLQTPKWQPTESRSSCTLVSRTMCATSSIFSIERFFFSI